jgi:hypothetical protein
VRLWLALVAASGCAPAEVTAIASVDAGCGCTRYRPPTQVGLTQSVLEELSGLVASRSKPGIYWAHNDSGDLPRFMAMQLDGTVVQTFTVAGATHVDWEDVGLGPCPEGTCVAQGLAGAGLAGDLSMNPTPSSAAPLREVIAFRDALRPVAPSGNETGPGQASAPSLWWPDASAPSSLTPLRRWRSASSVEQVWPLDEADRQCPVLQVDQAFSRKPVGEQTAALQERSRPQPFRGRAMP